jgi:hypothetical protein
MDSSFSSDLSRAHRFTTAPRPVIFDYKSKQDRPEDLPGPGAYRIERSSLAHNGVRFGNARRFTSISGDNNSVHSSRERSMTPGPGDYRTDTCLNKKICGGVIGRSRSRSVGATVCDTGPGPTSYAVPRDLFRRSTPGVVIPLAPRPHNVVSPAAESPGPCAYNPKETKFTPHAPTTFSRQRRQVLFPAKEDTPGPCSYRPETTPPRKCNNAGTFSRARKPTSFNNISSPTPGPGDYNPRWTKQSRF